MFLNLGNLLAWVKYIINFNMSKKCTKLDNVTWRMLLKKTLQKNDHSTYMTSRMHTFRSIVQLLKVVVVVFVWNMFTTSLCSDFTMPFGHSNLGNKTFQLELWVWWVTLKPSDTCAGKPFFFNVHFLPNSACDQVTLRRMIHLQFVHDGSIPLNQNKSSELFSLATYENILNTNANKQLWLEQSFPYLTCIIKSVSDPLFLQLKQNLDERLFVTYSKRNKIYKI